MFVEVRFDVYTTCFLLGTNPTSRVLLGLPCFPCLVRLAPSFLFIIHHYLVVVHNSCTVPVGFVSGPGCPGCALLARLALPAFHPCLLLATLVFTVLQSDVVCVGLNSMSRQPRDRFQLERQQTGPETCTVDLTDSSTPTRVLHQWGTRNRLDW